MSKKMAFWNNGSPRVVRVGQLDRVSGRFIGHNPDPELDLYNFEESGPKIGRFEQKSAVSYSNDGWTIIASWTAIPISDTSYASKLKQDVKLKRNQVRDAGIEWSPDGGSTIYVVQTDKDSRRELFGAVLRTDKKGSSHQRWRMADNSFVSLNKAKFDDMAMAVGDHIDACYVRQDELEAEIDAAELNGDFSAVDISVGWPPYYQGGQI